jgi:Right handed beta helix region
MDQRITSHRRMTPWATLAALLILAGLLGCPAAGDYDDDDGGPAGDDDDASDDDAGDDDGGDDDVGDDDAGDDDTADTGPCGDGTWGQIPQSGTILVVDDGAGSGGDGSLSNPFGTLEEAVDHARTINGEVVIGLAPGNYETNLELSTVSGQWSDDGLTVAGCSVEEVKLHPADVALPTVAVRGAEEITLRAFLVEGGDPGIVVADGSGTESPIRLEGLVVSLANRAGIVIDDTGQGDTSAVLSAVEVVDTVPVGGEFGWGIAVQHANATITGGRVAGVTQVGLFGHLAKLAVDGLEIDGVTVDDAGAYGRGVHLQLLCTGMVRNSTIDGCADAGIYVHTGIAVTLESNDVRNTQPAAIPDLAEQSGDGIVVTMGDEGFQPELFPAYLLGNTAEFNGRAGIVIDGVYAELVGNNSSNNVFDPGAWGIIAQNAAIIEVGGDSYYDMDADINTPSVELNTDELDWIQVASD